MKADEIKDRAKRGLTASLLRQVIVQTIGLITTIVLARCLTPGDFGLYGLVSLTVQFFTVFSATGLGLALIRQQEEPSADDLDAVFSFQFLLTSAVCFMIVMVAAYLPNFDQRFTRQAIYSMWALAISAWVTPFRLVPSILLERRLAFTKIALVEGVEHLVFNLVAMALAFGRAGAWALVVATLARAVVGVAMCLLVAPHRVRFRLRSSRLRPKLIVGLGFQVPMIVFFLKDLALPAFLLTMLGPTQLGYFVWVRDFLMKFTTFGGLFAKIAFPTLAKLSAGGAEVSGSLRQSSTLLGLAYWPAVSLLIATSSFYIHYIFSDQWFPARNFLMFFASALIFQIVINPWIALSQTRSPWTWPLKVAGAIGAWDIVAGFTLIYRFGMIGAGISIVLSNLLYAGLYYFEIKRLLPNTFRQALPNWLPKLILNAILSTVAFLLTNRYLDQPLPVISVVMVTALVVVFLNIFLFAEDRAMFSKIVRYLSAPLKGFPSRVYV